MGPREGIVRIMGEEGFIVGDDLPRNQILMLVKIMESGQGDLGSLRPG